MENQNLTNNLNFHYRVKLCVVAYKFGNEKEIGEHLGTYHYFIEKMRTLAKKGVEVYVVCPWLSFTKKGSTDFDGIKIVRYYPPLLNVIWAWPINRLVRLVYFKSTQRVVLKTVKKEKIDLVYIWQARETGYAICQIKERLGVPVYFRQITAWHWHFARSVAEIFGKNSWYQKIKKFGWQKLADKILEFLLDNQSQKKFAEVIYKKADKIIFLSQAAIKEGEELGLDKNKAVDLGIAIEEDLFKPLNQKESLRKELGIRGSKVILFIGRINFAEKGIGYLLESLPEVIKTMPDVNLVIIGGGENEKMFRSIEELKIKNNVQPIGKKPFTDLVKYINAADVFVTPSVWMEAFGQVTIEAMACGVPVVTTDAGASPEINLDSQTGLVVPIKNSAKLAEGIIKILRDSNLQRQLGENARQRVLDNYTYDVIINKFLEIIKL
ncbi:MAG: glycosyltransferase family 4 protein [Patescibacteria group bacterium]|jgi:glycosyltransferase involved in cell wall biosynthesis